MPRTPYFPIWVALGALAAVGTLGVALLTARAPEQNQPARRESTVTVKRRDFVRSRRLSGTVEAVESTTLSAPRLSGPNSSSLVITRLVRAGA